MKTLTQKSEIVTIKKVIEGDTMRCLETFDQSKTQEILDKYISIGKWDDVSIDIDGDIILWEEL